MSFKGCFEFLLRIHELINIDLPSQGSFRIGVSIYQQNKYNKIYAHPFQLAEYPEKSKESRKKIIKQSQCDIDKFYSKASVIKYIDEKAVLNDLIRFKMEIESFPTLETDNIYMEIEFYFSSKYSFSNEQFIGKKVSTKKYKLQTIQLGLFNYYEAQFDNEYNAKCGITLFACISNFKFGKYKLAHIQQIVKEDNDGAVKIEQVQSEHNNTIKERETDRCKINTFQEMLGWVEKYYAKKISNGLWYFYETYVKNLRYYFYHIQEKSNKKLLIPMKIILKVPKQFLELPEDQQKSDGITQNDQKVFRNYMKKFIPSQFSPHRIFSELHEIYSDIYQFMQKMQKQFIFNQTNDSFLRKQFESYIKQRYGERVFKSVVYDTVIDLSKDESDANNQINQVYCKKGNSQQNRKIAKKMREKKFDSIVSYPIIDVNFYETKSTMQYIFYEITYPKPLTQKKLAKKTEKQKKITENKIKGQQVQIDQEKAQIQLKTQVQSQRKNSFQQYQNQKLNQQLPSSEAFGSQISEIQAKSKQNGRVSSSEQQNSQSQAKISRKVSDGWKSDKGEKDLTEDLYGEQQDINYQSMILENTLKQEEEEYKALKKDSALLQYEQFLANYNEKNLLTVMCHGFQGSSFDMMLIYRGLKQKYPDANYLVSRANQDQTTGDIEQMGKRLSIEIINYIRNYLNENEVIINMVGHSMGGIIARAAIKHLDHRNFKFGFYFSLSSPHLGYMNGVDQKIKIGLWAIRKFNPIKSLEQLSMQDNSHPRSTLLYKLSLQGSLKKFKKIILWSSFQDSYVAWHSARIMVHQHKKKTSSVVVQEQMVKNILGDNPVHRLDINFNIKKNNIDSYIGRTAHINLIVQESLFKIINSTIPDLFDLRKP